VSAWLELLSEDKTVLARSELAPDQFLAVLAGEELSRPANLAAERAGNATRIRLVIEGGFFPRTVLQQGQVVSVVNTAVVVSHT